MIRDLLPSIFRLRLPFYDVIIQRRRPEQPSCSGASEAELEALVQQHMNHYVSTIRMAIRQLGSIEQHAISRRSLDLSAEVLADTFDLSHELRQVRQRKP